MQCYCALKDAFNYVGYIAPNGRMLYEFESMGMEFFVAYFSVMSCYLPEETEERFQEPLPGEPVSGQRPKLDTRVNQSTVTFSTRFYFF